jgi:hypothetical protein
MRATSPHVVGLGLVLALTAHPTGALGVTPDPGVQAGGEKLRVKQSDSVSVEYLRHQSTIEEMTFLTSDVIVLGTVERTGLTRVPPEGDGVWVVEVVLVVEECLKGPCGERVTFFAGTMQGAKYRQGERVLMVLVLRGRDDTRLLLGRHEMEKYLIDATNTVVRNGIPVEDFVAEVRELVAPSAATRLFETSDFVVIGEVVSVERGGTAEESDSPVTLRWGEGASIRVTQWLKGDSDRTHMTVLSTVPTRWQRIHDYVILEAGEVVLLFLREEDEGHYTVVGGHDGKYRLSDATAADALRELGRAGLIEH